MPHASIAGLLTDDHRHCDQRLATAEAHAMAGRWVEADADFASWHRALQCHLAREEELLFPAFERATGETQGPTAMMRMEHAQMRDLIEPMLAALAARDARRFLGLSESLMMLMQQHNMKEEQVLYPMCDDVLADRNAVAERLAAMQP